MKLRRTVDERPDYGIDAPYVIVGLILAGAACFLLSRVSGPFRGFIHPALSCFATAAIWLYGSKVGKLRIRDRMMDRLSLKGDERALDVGCGSGLLLIGAAKRLTRGEAVGIDIWQRRDLSNNRPEALLRNAGVEGVAKRVRVVGGDARWLPFADESFDVSLSLNVLHNIPKSADREKALKEILRVLKPSGRTVVTDFKNTREYVRALREGGLADAHRELVYWLFIPIFVVIAKKRS